MKLRDIHYSKQGSLDDTKMVGQPPMGDLNLVVLWTGDIRF